MSKIPREGNVIVDRVPGKKNLYSTTLNDNMLKGMTFGLVSKVYFKLKPEQWEELGLELDNNAIMNIDHDSKKIKFYPKCPDEIKPFLHDFVAAYVTLGYEIS